MQDLLEAVRVAYGGLDNERRGEATAFLDRLRDEKGKGIVDEGFRLAKGDDELIVKHFGYHLLEHAVEKHWHDYTEQEVGSWKEALMGVARVEATPLLQQKISHLVGIVALRLWPQQWPDLLAHLHTLWQMGDTQRDVAMRCFLAINEEASLHSYVGTTPHEKGVSHPEGRWDCLQIASDRKNEVLQAYAENSPGMLVLVNSYLMENYDAIMALQTSSRQIELCLQLLHKVCVHVSAKDMIHHGLTGWVRFATHPAVRMQAADIIFDVAEAVTLTGNSDASKVTGNEEVLKFFEDLLSFLSGFLRSDCDMLAENAGKYRVRDADVCEDFVAIHRFSVRIAEVIFGIAKNDSLFSQMCLVPSTRVVLSHVSAQLLTHPSSLVHLYALSFVKRMLCNPAMKAHLCNEGASFFSPLMRYMNSTHLCKTATFMSAVIDEETRGAGRYEEYYLNSMTVMMLRVEYEDQLEEIGLHHAHLTSVHREVSQLVNKAMPQTTLMHYVTAINGIITDLPSYLPAPDTPRSTVTGNVLHESVVYCRWSAIETAMMHLTDSFPDTFYTDATHDALFSELETRLPVYLDIQLTDGILLARYLGILQCLFTVLAKKHSVAAPTVLPALLSKCIEKVVSLMGHRLKHESGPIMSLDTISCRRKVQTVLLNLSDQFDRLLPSELPRLLFAWTEHQKTMTLTDQEISLLTESITTIANTLPDSDRGDVLCKLVQPFLAPWQSLHSYYASRDVFRQFIEGVLNINNESSELHSARSTLRKCMCVFQGVFRRSSVEGAGRTMESLGTLAQQLLPGIIELIGALHWVWKPDVMQGDAVRLLTISSEEKEQSTGGSVTRSSDLLLKGDALTPSQKLFVGRQYVCQLRASSYALLGSLASFNLQAYAAYQSQVTTLFNPDLYHIELLQLKYLFNDLCVPLMLLTPPQCYDKLREIASQLSNFLFHKMSLAWQSFHERYGGDTPSARGATFSNKQCAKVTTDDAWEFKLLTDLTSEVSGVFFHVATIAQGGLVNNTKLKKYTKNASESRLLQATCIEFCRSDQLMRCMVLLLTGAVSWPSAVSSVRATEAMLKLVSTAGKMPALSDDLVRLLGSALHRVASIQQQQSSKNRDSQLVNYLINLVTELYSVLFATRQEPSQMLTQMGIRPQVALPLSSHHFFTNTTHTHTPHPRTQDIVETEALLRDNRLIGKRRGKFKVLLNPKKSSDGEVTLVCPITGKSTLQ